MPDTRVRPAGPAAETQELQIRVACRGKSSADILGEVRRGLDDADAQAKAPLLVLEDLGFLKDSVTSLIKGLCRLLVGYPRPVTFWESSGYTEAFLSAMEAPKTR